MLLFITLGAQFESYIHLGTIHLTKTHRVIKPPKTAVYCDPDPAIFDFIHKKYWSAVVDS